MEMSEYIDWDTLEASQELQEWIAPSSHEKEAATSSNNNNNNNNIESLLNLSDHEDDDEQEKSITRISPQQSQENIPVPAGKSPAILNKFLQSTGIKRKRKKDYYRDHDDKDKYHAQCPFCNKKYAAVKGLKPILKKHIKSEHGSKKIKTEVLLSYITEPTQKYTITAQCPDCNFSYNRKNTILRSKYNLFHFLKEHRLDKHKIESDDDLRANIMIEEFAASSSEQEKISEEKEKPEKSLDKNNNHYDDYDEEEEDDDDEDESENIVEKSANSSVTTASSKSSSEDSKSKSKIIAHAKKRSKQPKLPLIIYCPFDNKCDSDWSIEFDEASFNPIQAIQKVKNALYRHMKDEHWTSELVNDHVDTILAMHNTMIE